MATQELTTPWLHPRVAAACLTCGYEPFRFRFNSDHRGFFLEFSTASLFGNQTIEIPPPAARSINARHRGNCIRYIKAKHRYLQNCYWFDRMATLKSSPRFRRSIAEALDKDWVTASRHAEKQCRRHPNIPFSHEIASKRKRKNLLGAVVSSKRRGISLHTAIDRATALSPDPIPPSLDECKSEYRRLKQEIRSLERQSVEKRRQEQHDLLHQRRMLGDKAGAKALRNIMIAEETKEMWRQLGQLERRGDQGVSSVEVPSNGDYSNNNCKSCDTWLRLDQPTEIEAALVRRNRLHFGQAHGTPPTTSPLSDTIDWAASTGPLKQSLLAITRLTTTPQWITFNP